MKSRIRYLLALVAFIGSSGVLTNQSNADPLPLRDFLKFDQEPMINTTIAVNGQVGVYQGHDEISTIYGPGNIATQPSYQGSFMADDFSDTVSRPVVHVTWWGSYHGAASAPQPPVQQFLIVFGLDNPATPGQFSYPKAPIQSEIVTPGGLSPLSGTFTETQVGGPDINGDLIYKYNAELANPFPEQANQIYWLQIAAVVNVPVGTPVPPPPGFTSWGWHNRDYTVNDPLAAPVGPGEVNEGTPANPIWHFQDDSVQGALTYNPTGVGINQQVIQTNPLPQNYVDLADGPTGIGNHSKDLAFRLYTTQVVPEPATCTLMVLGLAGALATRRRVRIA
jgi:hypothetical protein